MRTEHVKPSQAKTSPADPNRVQAFFADLGLVWREEGEGRLYPLANKAASRARRAAGGRAARGRGGARADARRCASSSPPPEGDRLHVRLADGSGRAGRGGHRGRGRSARRAACCPRAFPAASRSRRPARWPPSRAGRADSTIPRARGAGTVRPDIRGMDAAR